MWDTGVKDADGKNVVILLAKAGEYLTEEFWTCLDVFFMTETVECLPFGGGWAEQPFWIAQVLSILKSERNLLERKEIEDSKKNKK